MAPAACCACFAGLRGPARSRRKPKPHIAVIGDFIVDVLAKVPKLPGWDEDVETSAIEVFPSGSATNTARQVSLLVPGVTFFSTVGNDFLGHAGLDQLRSQGFDTSHMRHLPLPTSTRIVMSAPQDKGIAVCYSTVNEVSAANIDAPALLACDHLHIGGYFGLRGLQTDDFLDLVRRFRSEGGSVSLGTNADTSGCWVGEGGHLLRLLPLVDLLVVNEREIAECERALGSLHEFSPALSVVTTCGERGCIVWPTGNGSGFLSVPGIMVSAPEDLTGADDAFAAGLIACWVRNRDVVEAARWGNACALLAIRRGATCAVPASLSEVEASVKDVAY